MKIKPITKIKPLIEELKKIVPSDFLISNDFDKACIKANLDEVWQSYKDLAGVSDYIVVGGHNMDSLYASEALIMYCNDIFNCSSDKLFAFIEFILSSYCKSSNKKIPVKELKECFELIGINDDKLSKLDKFAKSEFEEKLVERDDEKTDIEKIRSLEEKFKNFSSLNANSYEAIDAYHEWYNATLLYLNNLLNEDEDFVKFKNLDNSGNGYSLQNNYHEILGIYNLLLKKSLLIQNKDNMIKTEVNKKVFIVHGHDDAMRLDVTRFIEHLNLKPIILSEQPNNGQTIIEKFESNSDVGYAIILLSPCDKGWSKDSELSKPMDRARQNVIMELGFFIGKLGRANVCALKNGDIELPSDVLGVSYIDYSSKDGGWKMNVAKELKESGYDIDMNLLI